MLQLIMVEFQIFLLLVVLMLIAISILTYNIYTKNAKIKFLNKKVYYLKNKQTYLAEEALKGKIVERFYKVNNNSYQPTLSAPDSYYNRNYIIRIKVENNKIERVYSEKRIKEINNDKVRKGELQEKDITQIFRIN